jgi:hypothetical protein
MASWFIANNEKKDSRKIPTTVLWNITCNHINVIKYIWSTLMHSISKKSVKGLADIQGQDIIQRCEHHNSGIMGTILMVFSPYKAITLNWSPKFHGKMFHVFLSGV